VSNPTITSPVGSAIMGHPIHDRSLDYAIVVEELHPQDGAFLVFGGREIAVAAADDDVLFVGNVGSVKRGLELVGLSGIVGVVLVAVDDEGGRQPGWMYVSGDTSRARASMASVGSGQRGGCGRARGMASGLAAPVEAAAGAEPGAEPGVAG